MREYVFHFMCLISYFCNKFKSKLIPFTTITSSGMERRNIIISTHVLETRWRSWYSD
jgi:hypothetical protein